MDNQSILAALKAAMKSITVTDLGDSVLQPGKLDRFIQAAQRRTNVLQEARFMQMDSQQEDIDRIGFAGRVITAGIKSDGTTVGTEATVKPGTDTNKLQAAELRGKTAINDRALRRNIERGTLEDTLVDLFGEAAGRDIEEMALLGDKTLGAGAAPNIRVTDGWLKKAANTIETVDMSAATYPENLFEAALLELPKQFLLNPAEFRFYVPWEVANAYHNLLIKRKTPLGDTAIMGRPVLTYKSIPIIPTAMLERSEEYKLPMLFSHPSNMVWGVFHQVTIEPKRVPEDRKTEFYLTVEADVHFEDENGAVAVLVEDDS